MPSNTQVQLLTGKTDIQRLELRGEISPGEINVHLQDTDGMILNYIIRGMVRDEKTIHRLSIDNSHSNSVGQKCRPMFRCQRAKKGSMPLGS